MQSGPSDIMTIEEVAEFLRIPVSSVYKLAKAGKIPATKIGKHWRFHRPILTSWFESQVAAAASPAGQTVKKNPITNADET